MDLDRLSTNWITWGFAALKKNVIVRPPPPPEYCTLAPSFDEVMSLKPTLRLPPTPSGLIFLVGQSPTAAKCPRPLELGAAAQSAEPPTYTDKQ